MTNSQTRSSARSVIARLLLDVRGCSDGDARGRRDRQCPSDLELSILGQAPGGRAIECFHEHRLQLPALTVTAHQRGRHLTEGDLVALRAELARVLVAASASADRAT